MIPLTLPAIVALFWLQPGDLMSLKGIAPSGKWTNLHIYIYIYIYIYIEQ